MGAHPIAGRWGRMHLATRFASDPEDDPGVAVLLCTTGTAGAPKGVMLSHASLCLAGRSAMAIRGMTAADLIHGVLPFTWWVVSNI